MGRTLKNEGRGETLSQKGEKNMNIKKWWTENIIKPLANSDFGKWWNDLTMSQESRNNTANVIEEIVPEKLQNEEAINVLRGESIPTIEGETLPATNGIVDETQKNTESQVIGSDIMQFMEQQQEKQWAREDQIRKEIQAREDNAWQRAVKDMQAAGINPNLVNAAPAASGGGITSATGMNYTPYTEELNEALTLLEQEIDNAFKEDENKKERFMDVIGNVLNIFLASKFLKK